MNEPVRERRRVILWCVMLCALFGAAMAAAFGADLPDPALTPGMIDANVQDVCTVKWGHDARHVTVKMKKQVFADYDIPWSDHAKYEVDHLISRELGGADATNNLWPQSWTGHWNAHMKDRLENRLHKDVCAGRLTLKQAQIAISGDWTAVYRTYFGEP